MGWMARTIVHLRGGQAARSLIQAMGDPARAQKRFLERLLARNAQTAFGREHGFAEIRNVKEYAERVPVRDYEGFRSYVKLLTRGERSVLTVDDPFMFTTTSGTTGEPKLLPVTRPWKSQMASLMRVWVHWAALDHPGMLDGSGLSIVSPAVEGHTSSGMPIGAVSGLTYRRVPWVVRRNYAIPYEVSHIADYEDRYLVSMRLAMARDVTVVAAPNPSTLIRLAEVARRSAETLIRAIHDGRLGVSLGPRSEEQHSLYARIETTLSPRPKRARELEQILAREGDLLPRHLWPRLALIACWLGGSCGRQAQKLEALYGPVPLRDIGFRASEATMTVPTKDGTPAGRLALHTAFYEFIPEESIKDASPPVALAQDLELGRRYCILLTTSAGLYRYDISDVVEVVELAGRAPLVAFVRKGRDMVSITGEKLHINQVLHAMQVAQEQIGVDVAEFCIIPDVDASRYDLLVELPQPTNVTRALELCSAFDRALAGANIEYKQKRSSGRLVPPRLHLMRPGWAERRWRVDVARGKRDSQYKWSHIHFEWPAESRAEVLVTLEDSTPSRTGA